MYCFCVPKEMEIILKIQFLQYEYVYLVFLAFEPKKTLSHSLFYW